MENFWIRFSGKCDVIPWIYFYLMGRNLFMHLIEHLWSASISNEFQQPTIYSFIIWKIYCGYWILNMGENLQSIQFDGITNSIYHYEFFIDYPVQCISTDNLLFLLQLFSEKKLWIDEILMKLQCLLGFILPRIQFWINY
jgi:hypothetical protein